MGNHGLVESSVYKGTFETLPIFAMYAINRFPGLKDGANSVVMEVYEVTPHVLAKIDGLESYTVGSNNNEFYDRTILKTPWGMAYTYMYVPSILQNEEVESGDWKEYFELNIKLRKVLENADTI